MRFFLYLFGTLCTALIAMIEVPSDRATNLLAGWFRDGDLPGIADWLSAPITVHFIRHYAVWGLAVIAFICFFGVPLWHIFKRFHTAWIKRNSRLESARPTIAPYLHDEDSELGSAIRDMATYSAWAKWFASQFLANNNHRPVSQRNLTTIASGEVLGALMDGKILARGRTKWKPRTLWRRQPSDATEYEDISREAWRLAGIRMEPHPNTLWRAVLFPRENIDPERIKKLLDYDSIIVNSREFEKLWPRVDKFTDNARKKLLKKARKAGADPEHIEKLSQGHMATWP